jgi:hypothetical protein
MAIRSITVLAPASAMVLLALGGLSAAPAQPPPVADTNTQIVQLTQQVKELTDEVHQLSARLSRPQPPPPPGPGGMPPEMMRGFMRYLRVQTQMDQMMLDRFGGERGRPEGPGPGGPMMRGGNGGYGGGPGRFGQFGPDFGGGRPDFGGPGPGPRDGERPDDRRGGPPGPPPMQRGPGGPDGPPGSDDGQ